MTRRLFFLLGSRRIRVGGLLGVLSLGGCVVGPDYHGPPPETTADLPTAYKHAPARGRTQGPFRVAEPAGAFAGGHWWVLFDDAELARLEVGAGTGSPDLAQAVQRIEEARAQARVARADLYPDITTDPNFTRSRSTSNGAEQRARVTGSVSSLTGSSSSSGAGSPTYTGSNGPLLTEKPVSATIYDFRVPVDLSWELDLFGRIRRNAEAARAEAQAAEDDLAATRLSVTANVAVNYYGLRELDAEQDILERTIAIRRDAVGIAEERLTAGLTSELDVQRERADLASNEADLAGVRRSRADTENAMATLVGVPASNLRLRRRPLQNGPPRVPAGLPSRLLERRPDVASAERNLAADNARIGAAKAAFFPDVRLTSAAGFETANIGTIVAAQSAIWSVGPSVRLPIFEGFRNEANLQNAKAAYLGQVSHYRAQVLQAFQDVENAFAALRFLAAQAGAEAVAVEAARGSLELSQRQYQQGAVTFLDVLDAERTLLSDERSAAQILGARLQATVQLVKALGGIWD